MRRSLLDQLDPPFLDNHGATWTSPTTYKMRGDARRYETWEFPYAAIVGLGVATEYAMSLGTHDVETRVIDLAARLRAALEDIPSVTVRDLGLHKGAIVTFTHAEMGAESIVARLYEWHINTSLTPPASTRIDADRRNLPDMVRASVHYYNTNEEIEEFVMRVANL